MTDSAGEIPIDLLFATERAARDRYPRGDQGIALADVDDDDQSDRNLLRHNSRGDIMHPQRVLSTARAVAFLLGSLTCGSAIAQGVWLVDSAAKGANDGTSWADAYTDLQVALASATAGDEIWVASGVYRPASFGGDRAATFQLPGGVALLGGFVGGETDREYRDPAYNLTELSGDLNDNDDPGFTSTEDNSYHVVTGSGTDETAILDGFTISAGFANGGNDHNRGGGMFNDGGSPTVRRCLFSGNWAMWDGGGMYNVTSSRPTVADCVFADGFADRGGGMFNRGGSDASVVRSRFLRNEGKRCGGGMFNEDSDPDAIDCVFVWNFTDPIIGNSRGGAIYNRGGGAELINCTVTQNTATQRGGGLYVTDSSTVDIRNSIFWGNSAGVGPELAARVSSTITVNYSDVQGGQAATHINSSTLNWQMGNITVAPAFANDAEDLRLSPISPCIDAADPGLTLQCGDTDLDRHPRVLCNRMDMGAFEFGVGDFDCDRTVDLIDYDFWSSCVVDPEAAGCEAFYFDRGCQVDLISFARFQVASNRP
jgi:predicted outer membrane repeat protein